MLVQLKVLQTQRLHGVLPSTLPPSHRKKSVLEKYSIDLLKANKILLRLFEQRKLKAQQLLLATLTMVFPENSLYGKKEKNYSLRAHLKI